MHNRIKLIRADAGLKQAEFGNRIGIKQNTVAVYESGRVVPSDVAINNICKEFRVNEKWLRTGEGEQYVPVSRKEQLAIFFGDVMKDDDESFRVRFFNALAEYTEDDWKVLEKLFTSAVPSTNEKEDV